MDSLTLPDILIVLAYFVSVLFIGIRFGKKDENIEGYVAGGRQMPWLAVLGSLIATEISAATFLGTPGVGFAENLGYLQMGFGSLLARFAIAFLFLGAFYKLKYLSVYQFLATRFGGTSHYTAASFFLMSRLMASAVRLMIASTGLYVILGLPFGWTMIGFASLCLIYAGIGGIKAVIWTDCLQVIVFLTAGLVMLFVLQDLVGWGTILNIGNKSGKLEIFQWTPQAGIMADSNWVLLAVVFGFINTLAMQGTDHDFTQRMLTCKNVKQARRGIILSGFISLPVAAMFLLIGVGLFAYFQQIPDASLPTKIAEGVISVDSDKVFPHFISTVLPAGLRGLLLCGVLAAAMSSLDSAMAALSSSIVVDLLKPFLNKNETTQVWTARIFMVVVTVALVSIAWALKDGGQFIWLAFKIAGVTYSGLLGVFLVGLLSNRGADRWNLFAMITGSSFTAILLLLSEKGVIQLAWQYPMLVGVCLTFLLGIIPKAAKTQVQI
ncbi:MAG: sodium/solute symporter [Verrucomicrobia bacterium]|nr:sodium/solute symporter [Verrucomicrobiota bacterium]